MNTGLLRHIFRTMHLVLPLLVALPASSQTKSSSGEFGAVDVSFGGIRNSGAVFVGGRGGWVIDQNYAIGIGGYLLASDVSARVPDTSRDNHLMVSYGGLDLEYTHPLSRGAYLTARALVGGGAVGHVENVYLNPRPHYDPFLVVEPGLTVDVSLSEIFKLSAGVGYRFAGLLSSNAATNGDLTGVLFNISVKAGFF